MCADRRLHNSAIETILTRTVNALETVIKQASTPLPVLSYSALLMRVHSGPCIFKGPVHAATFFHHLCLLIRTYLKGHFLFPRCLNYRIVSEPKQYIQFVISWFQLSLLPDYSSCLPPALTHCLIIVATELCLLQPAPSFSGRDWR